MPEPSPGWKRSVVSIGPINPGTPAPLGATCSDTGVNFSVYSPAALGLDLLLFDSLDTPQPIHTLSLDPLVHRTGDFWHVAVSGLGHGQVYGWRVRGPKKPGAGHSFDGDKVLLDPYARAVGDRLYRRRSAAAGGDNCACALRSVVVDPQLYDWEEDRPLPPVIGREYLYEMHLAGFTKSPTSGLPENLRGTYAGLVTRIPYLQELGVTTVELLPVFQFDSQDAPTGLTNVWGYSTQSFFAPHRAYSSAGDPLAAVDEFRDMVKALHRAGIRVVLDVVFNHTAEGGRQGPTLSWRGFADRTYYLQDSSGSGYADFTGCGNTFNANHPVVARLIRDSLRYWVQHMHVDGFRFDLASALTRDGNGAPLENPPLIRSLETDPVLAGTSLTAEAWDTGGLYQVGSFPGPRFATWNGPFRDHLRRFWRGDQGTIENLMARLVGSPDLFSRPTDRPSGTINFVTCHDGFSLADLVAYARKNNLANGEDNRDGSDNNDSCNHGVEGPTDDPDILAVRARQTRNFLASLFLSHGTPMLLMGDEVAHTRQGNNNPWCQDNALNWLDWQAVENRRDLLGFVQRLIRYSETITALQTDRFWTATSPRTPGDITWHGTRLGQPDWKPTSQAIAWTLGKTGSKQIIHVMLNASGKDQVFQLPPNRAGHHWLRVIDTAALSPADLVFPGPDSEILAGSFKVKQKSLVLVEEWPISL